MTGGAEHEVLELSAATGDGDDPPTGPAEESSLFTGSPGHTSSQVDGDHAVADVSDHDAAAIPFHYATSATDISESASVPARYSLSLNLSSRNCVLYSADHAADHAETTETQVYQPLSQQSTLKSLQTVSAEPTLLDFGPPGLGQPDGGNSLANGHQPTQILQPENGTEPSTSATKVVNSPSANRLSISYSRGVRRLVINAEVVDTLKLYRQEGRIEVTMKVEKDNGDALKGILVSYLNHFKNPETNVCQL